MVIRELSAEAEKILSSAGCENARHTAQLIMRDVFSLDPLGLAINANTDADEEKALTVTEYAKRRALGEPLEYILGTQEFMSLEFDVNPSVLIPRADTETLAETVIGECKKHAESLKLLDIGAGSGCIGISIAHYTDNTHITEVDISENALSTAKRNAEKNKVSDRMSFIQCDILSDIPDGKFDIIVSNPPYIETEVVGTLDTNVRDFEPHTALDGGSDGLVFYRRITEIASDMLNDGGILAFEIGYNQGKSVSELMSADFDGVRIIKDLCNNDRVVIGTLKRK